MIISFFRLLSGVLRVRFYGEFKEKILSLCAQNGISLRSSKLMEKGIECEMSVSNFRNLRELCRGKGIRVHIIEKKGVPFLLKRYNRRLGIAVGTVIFFVGLILMSQYIWVIDIDGNQKVSDEKIRAACEEIGVVTGIRKNSIYPKAVREELMLKLDGVAWSSLNIEGCRLTVNISESAPETESKTYSNLKAESDGVIEKIDVISGTVVVSVGQAVKKGDLLVSGIVETADGTSFVNAKGSVTARSQKYVTVSQDFVQEYREPNGQIKKKRVMELFGVKIPLFLGGEKGDYSCNGKAWVLELFGKDLPIKFYEKTYSFENVKTQRFTLEELNKRLENELLELCQKDGFTVLEKETTPNETKLTLKALVETKENIAKKEKILINSGN